MPNGMSKEGIILSTKSFGFWFDLPLEKVMVYDTLKEGI